MGIKGYFQTEEKLTNRDKIRRNFVYFLTVIFAPLIGFVIYWKIAGSDFVGTEIGSLLLVVIVVMCGIGASLLYEYLFPRYKNDTPR